MSNDPQSILASMSIWLLPKCSRATFISYVARVTGPLTKFSPGGFFDLRCESTTYGYAVFWSSVADNMCNPKKAEHYLNSNLPSDMYTKLKKGECLFFFLYSDTICVIYHQFLLEFSSVNSTVS